jgi:hypothetical protein
VRIKDTNFSNELKKTYFSCESSDELKRIATLEHILYKEENFEIIGACMKVDREIGTGFLGALYEESLEKEYKKSNIPYRRQTLIQIYYEGEPLKKEYRSDFICCEYII